MATLNEIASALRKADAAGDAEAARRLAQAYSRQKSEILSLIEEPKEEAGFFGSFKDAVTTLGLTDEAAAYAANPTEENRQKFLKKAESKYKSVGGFGKGENWEAFKELLGGSLGALVAPIAGGVAGAAAGPLGGIAGFAGTSAAQYNIQNLRRQAEEQQAAAEAGEAVPELALGKAAGAATLQAGLDVIPGALILKALGKFPIAQRLLAQDETSSKAANVLIDAFRNKNLSLKGNVVKGVGLGVAFEVPQEIAQQALERWQAGLPLDDEEAKEEFKQAAIGAAILGGGFGAIGGAATYRGEQAERDREAADLEARRQQELADIEASLYTQSTEGGIPASFFEPETVEETEAQREARLEREAIQAYEREQAERAQADLLGRTQYSAQTLREAAEAEALAPREEDEGAPYIPPSRDEEEITFTPPRTPEEEAELTEDMRAYAREDEAEQAAPTPTELTTPSTEGVMEGLGAPTEGGIPAEMFEPTAPTSIEPTPTAEVSTPAPRELALEVIQTTPTIKAISEATGLNQPQAAALMRQFVDEGIVERVGNKFRLAVQEAPDVPSATVTTPEADVGTSGGSADLFTLGPPPGELGAAPTGTAGLAPASDVTERVDEREGDVLPALETEGVLEGLGAPTEGGVPAEALEKYLADRAEIRDLKERALNFIRQTGQGSAPALQKALGISLTRARALRDALLGSGQVIERGNVRGAKGGKYYVTEGDYLPSGQFIPRAGAVPETRQEPEAVVGSDVEALGLEGASTPDTSGLPPDMLEGYLRIEDARQAAAARQRGEGVESETEVLQRRADVSAEKEITKELPSTLKPEIGKGEYGLKYTDTEGNTVYKAYPSAAERSQARSELAMAGNKNFSTFSRMAEAAKFELAYMRGRVTPAMTEAQVRRAVEGVKAGMTKLKTQLGMFTEEEAPTPKKEPPKRVTPREVLNYANRITELARDSGKLKKYAKRIQLALDAVKRGDADLRAEYRTLQRIEDNILKSEAEYGEARQAGIEEDVVEGRERIEDEETGVRGREEEDYKPLDFRKIRFQKRKSQTTGMQAPTLQNLLNKITAGWKNPPNFIVVQSYLDLPEGFDPESNADTMGIAIGNDVYLIADNIRTLSDLKATVFHESLGHYGLARLFGERLLQTMLDIYNTNARMRADADAWLAENPDTYPESEYTQNERRAMATEEILAEISESGPITNSQYRAAFNRVAALIRKFARALAQIVGRDVAYSNREIADIIAQAHNQVISGKTRLVPRYNNIRYMKNYYNKVMRSSLDLQQKAPEATKEFLLRNVRALSNVPNPLRNFKLSTFSLHHMMQLFEGYARGYKALNNMVERKSYDATKDMIEFARKETAYRGVLRRHKQFVDAFNKVAHLINLSQAPVFEEQLNASGDFLRFVPSVAAQRMRNIPENSAAYTALSPEDKVLHEAVNKFYALPPEMQQMMADIYTDYRNYSDQAFKIKLNQLLNKLPAAVVAGIKANFNNNRLRFYLPLPREGMYKLSYLDSNGNRNTEFFGSLAERDAAEQARTNAGMVVLTGESKVLQQRTYDQSSTLPPGLLKELLENVETSLKNLGVASKDVDVAKETVFDTFIEFMPGAYGNDLRQEISSRKTFQLNGVTYYGRLGFNEDVLGTYSKRIPNIIYQINNLKYTMPFEKVRKMIKEQLDTYRNNRGSNTYAGLEELDDDYIQSLKEDLDSRVTFAKKLQQYSPYVYTISKANYIYSIALNVSSALINTTIVPMMAWPAMAAKYGAANSARAIGQAMQLFFKHSYRDPRTGRVSFDYKRLADMPASFGGPNMPSNYAQTAHGKEFERLHKTLLARSVVGTAAEQELIQAENINFPGYEGLSAKVNLAMSYVFRSSERMNREVTSLAAYMLARNIDIDGQPIDPNRQGVSVSKAAEEAIRLNYDVNGATTPETHSRLYQTDIGRIVLTFRTHALNMMLNIAFTFDQAIEKINANQPNAAERKLFRSIARRKLLYIFGSTYMLAGLKGLPLFGAAEVLASLLMGDDDEPYDLEQEVLDSVGTLGVNGPINELLNIDIASRTGFYGLLWRDDPKRLAEVGIPVYILERLAGPTYGLVEAGRRGLKDLADGELVRASEALTPAPIRNMIKGMRYGIEGAQTRDGLPIVEDVNVYNSMMQVLGFAPADLATAQAQRGATYQVSEKLKNRRVALLTNLYAARKAGNSEGMEKALNDIRSFNEANPSYRITGDTINKSYSERERRAREAIGGVYQPKNLRIAASQYVADLDEEEDIF